MTNQTTKKPEFLPEKFWDKETEQPRLDALVKSYKELEKKFSKTIQVPKGELKDEEKKDILKLLGRPETAEEYTPNLNEIELDNEANKTMHNAGFTQEQVQVVYDLAEKKLIPQLKNAEKNTNFAKEEMLLKEYFGSEENVEKVAKQVLSFAEKTFENDLAEQLCNSAKGVIGLYQMMHATREPKTLAGNEGMQNLSDQSLRKMMKNPKYWKDQDPEYIQKVKDGFADLYRK
ncbi:MAG: capsid assembly protein [Alphaproteobacteria bacterium]